MYLLRRPSPHAGNVGDAALEFTLKSLLDFYNIDFYCPRVKEAESIEDYEKFKGLIYFGNDTIAYYGISKKLIRDFINLDKPIYLINTSYGEDKKNNFLGSIGSYKHLRIWARDVYSQALIQEDVNPVNSTRLCADLAHLCPDNYDLTNLDPSQSKLINWINSTSKPIIAINLHQDYGENNLNVQEQLNNFINFQKSKYSFLFLPHDSRKTRKELEINKSFYENHKSYSFLSEVLNPSFELKVLRRMHSVITCRMHLGILSLRSNIPSLIIGYNGVKAKGLLSHWNLEEELYVNPSNKNEIDQKFNNIASNYSKILEHISIKSNYVNNLAFDPIDFLLEKKKKK